MCLVQRIPGGGGTGAWLPDLPQSRFREPLAGIQKPQDRNQGCLIFSTFTVPRELEECPMTDLFALEWAALGNDC